MNTIAFMWFYGYFLIACGLTRVIQILTRNVMPPVSAGLGALI